MRHAGGNCKVGSFSFALTGQKYLTKLVCSVAGCMKAQADLHANDGSPVKVL